MKNSLLLFLLLIFTNACGMRNDQTQTQENNILCVEVDEIGNDDHEALREPEGEYILIKTNPLNFQSSLYRYTINKKEFNFFCSPQSNWSFQKVGLERIYTNNFGLKKIEYKLRRVFHYNPDGAELLITSTWFLTDKIPDTNNIKEIKMIKSHYLSQEINRLRNLEQATFCMQPYLVMNKIQQNICDLVIKEFNKKYSIYKKEIFQDAIFIQNQNM